MGQPSPACPQRPVQPLVCDHLGLAPSTQHPPGSDPPANCRATSLELMCRCQPELSELYFLTSHQKFLTTISIQVLGEFSFILHKAVIENICVVNTAKENPRVSVVYLAWGPLGGSANFSYHSGNRTGSCLVPQTPRMCSEERG